MQTIKEVCVDSLEDAINAEKNGANACVPFPAPANAAKNNRETNDPPNLHVAN